MFEEEPPKPVAGYRLGENLEAWSVEDLADLVDNLKSEIERVQTEVARKRGDLSAAESLFKS